MQDLQLAREMQQRFEDWKRERGNAIDLDVSVTVLTTGYWPTYKAVELVLPKEMADGIQQFRVRHPICWRYKASPLRPFTSPCEC